METKGEQGPPREAFDQILALLASSSLQNHHTPSSKYLGFVSCLPTSREYLHKWVSPYVLGTAISSL